MNKILRFNISGCAIVAAAALMTVSTASSAVIRQGPTYTPTGADFTIVALQGIGASDPLGQSGVNPQVNNNFEFSPSIGVTYDQGNNHLTDFGLGLYQDSSHATQSTGLRVNYNAPVDAASVTITVEDFDIKLSDGGFDLQHKVAPTISLLGANNTVVATFGPSDIFPAMTERPTANGHGESDIWDINFGALLNQLHLSSSQITGFLLAADSAHGETSNSDPYLLLAIGNGIPVIPEASNYIAGLVAIVIAGLSLKRKSAKA
jgi:hypothetical protein